MDFIILVFIFFIIRQDLRIFKRQNEELFKRIFKVRLKITVLFFIVAWLISIFFWGGVFFCVLIFLSVFLFYLLMRRRFVSALQAKENLESEAAGKSGNVETGDVVSPLVSMSQALGIVLVWFFCLSVLTLFLNRFIFFYQPHRCMLWEMLFVTAASFSFVLFLIYKASGKFPGGDILTALALRKGDRPLFKVVFVPVFAGLFLSFISAFIVISRPIQPQTPLSEIIENTESPAAILFFIIMAVFIAPFVEEIIFRGYFYRVISRFKSKKFAIYFIAMTFLFLHVGQYWGDWIAILMVAIVGFTLTILRAWSGTTIASIVTHYVYNGGTVIFIIFMMFLKNPAYYKYIINYSELDIQRKEELLKESMLKRPEWADAYNDLAWLYAEENKNLNEALTLIEKALSITPDSLAYQDTKARILFMLKKFDEAIELRDKLLKEHPDWQIPGYLSQY